MCLRIFSTLKAQVVQRQVQQAPMNSSTVVAQVSEKQLKHVPRESPTIEAHDIQDQVQQETHNSEENELSGELGPVTQKNKRGNTVMQNVHGRQGRKLVVLNKYNQPIGPTNAIVTELGSFLGTLARNAMLCPLNIHNWKNMDTKKICGIIPSAKKWALEGNKNARRMYKNDLYEKNYKAYDNDDLRMANKPKDVSESDFKDLLKYWDSKKFKAEMEKLQSQQSEDDDQSFDAFTPVMGDEHPGSMRLYGRGVTKSTLKRKALSRFLNLI
uniref:Ubiquitin n=1 Tax=Solanum tuberosum TaxID=4113 RepID=M1D8F0_SOLTU